MKLFKKRKKKQTVKDALASMPVVRKHGGGQHTAYVNPDGPLNRFERREQAKRMGLSWKQYKELFSAKIEDA